MCCTTHDERDRDDNAHNVAYLMAASDRTRCQCTYGNPCRRFADREDLLCEWCRGRNHENACVELAQKGYAGFASIMDDPIRFRAGRGISQAMYEDLRRNPPKFQTEWRGKRFTVEWKDEG